jgi:transposase-like protein
MRQWGSGTLSTNGAKVEATNGRRWWKYSPEFKRQAVDRMCGGESVTAVARELGIRRKFLYAWREAGFGSSGAPPRVRAANSGERQASAGNQRIAELERLVGRQAAELDFFAAALRSIEESRPASGGDSGDESTPRSRRPRKAR